MIEQLNGIHETVHHKKETHLRLYLNDEYEHYPPHWHTDMEILCPTEGVYSAICEKKTYHLNTGDILLIGGCAIHDLPAAEGKRIIFQISWTPVLGINGIQTVLGHLQSYCLVTPESLPLAYPDVHQDLMDICSLYKENALTSEAQIYAKAIDMISLIDKHLQQKNADSADICFHQHTEAMQSVCSYIQEHCSENISLEQAAKIAGFSQYYFARLFRAHTDQSFHQYLIGKRILAAEELLVDSELSITEVALQAGFANNAAFCKAFKQARNMSPTAFRKLYQNIL